MILYVIESMRPFTIMPLPLKRVPLVKIPHVKDNLGAKIPPAIWSCNLFLGKVRNPVKNFPGW